MNSTIQNLLPNSDPSAVGLLGPNDQVTVAVYAWPAGPCANAVRFVSNAIQRYAYQQANTSAGKTYTLSVYVTMDDASVPVTSGAGAGSDFTLVVWGVAANATHVVSMGGGVYRLDVTFAGSTGTSNFGVLKYVTNSAKGFRVSGYQLVEANWPGPYCATTVKPVDNGKLRNLAGTRSLA